MPADDEDDDKDEKGLEDDPEDITNLEEAKSKIQALFAEGKRKEDYMKRLQRKLQTLDGDLAQKREEVEGLQRTIHLEKSKHQDEKEARKREKEAKMDLQENRIRDYLSEVLFQKPSNKVKKAFELDTVLVSFIKPSETVRYNLVYRIDDNTMVQQLRTDACKYWDVSEHEFILKTMANSKCQNDIRVKDCFKQGELAQLRLEAKHRENVDVSEAEQKAIQPKGRKGPRSRSGASSRINVEGVDAIQKQGDGYSQHLKRMGGIFMLLKLRDMKPSEHSNKIKLRDVVLFTLLAVITFYTYVQRRDSGSEYWSLKGVERALLNEYIVPRAELVDGRLVAEPKGLALPVKPFLNITDNDHLWEWLIYALPEIFWTNSTNSFTQYNALLGYLSIRVQNVKEPNPAWEFCPERGKSTITNFPDAKCFAPILDELTEAVETDPRIKRYWNYVVTSETQNTVPIRGPTQPWKWRSKTDNKEKKMGNLWGLVQTYGPTGYSVDYRMKVPDHSTGRKTFRSDMFEFKRMDWIGARARVVIVSFTTYNFEYDLWAAADFLFEIPPSGIIQPVFSIRAFRPDISETKVENMNSYLDMVRLLIGLYILTAVGMAERKHKTKNHKGGYLYHTSLNGLMDLAIVVCLLASFLLKYVGGKKPTNEWMTLLDSSSLGFVSLSDIAYQYEQLFIVEGLLFTFNMYRLLSLIRLNHTVFMLWHTIGDAIKAFTFMLFLFFPVVIGFTMMAHNIWGRFVSSFGSLSSTSLALLKFVKGDLDFTSLAAYDKFWSVGLFISFYFFITFILLNVFTMILVDAYYTVKLTAEFDPDDELVKWNAQRWKKWIVPQLCLNIYQTLTRDTATPGET